MNIQNEKIRTFLEKRLNEKNIDCDKFLNPSTNDLRDPFLLKNMDKLVERLNKAIDSGENILVYGDYDCDGICATTIMYEFLKSKNANVDVFIPNRFENGYGISVDAIEEILENYSPNLILTVDLGITAVEEVELLKQEGIDVVITDHHIPLEEVPDTIVVDPKFDSKEYGFDGLCGAGVAFNVVEAVSGRDEALKYLDLCAIATIGDIVPLVDENRVIAKFGIDKINNGLSRPSIKYLLEVLEISKLNSSIVSFKIVPRINACGRMDNALKVFDFLIETKIEDLKIKYAEIENDNDNRLKAIEKGNKEIEKLLANYDYTKPAILIKGDFHEGIIGILASRICGDYNRPAIIFTTDENGILKGSGRSIDKINIHEIISSLSPYLENFGGHKMACGVSVLPENFDEFCNRLNEKILEQYSVNDLLIEKKNADICFDEDEIDMALLGEFEKLEPFGCENEKPTLSILQEGMICEPINDKNFQHFRLFTKHNQQIVAFNAYNDISNLKNNSKKEIFIDLSESYFKNKANLSVTYKNFNIIDARFGENENELLASLYNLYYSIFDFNDKTKYIVVDDVVSQIKSCFEKSSYGTLVVVSNQEDLNLIKSLDDKYLNSVSGKTFKNAQNTILISPSSIYKLEYCDNYENIIFLHKHFENEHLYFSQKMRVYEPKNIQDCHFDFSKDRQVFANVYNLVSNFNQLKSNDEIDYAMKLSCKSEMKASQILLCLIVFMELNFIEFNDNNFQILKAKKMELSSSKFFNEV